MHHLLRTSDGTGVLVQLERIAKLKAPYAKCVGMFKMSIIGLVLSVSICFHVNMCHENAYAHILNGGIH